MAVDGRKRSGISVEKNSAEGTEGEGGIVGIPWKMRIVEFARQQAVVFLNNAKNSWNPQGLEHFLPESEKDFFFFCASIKYSLSDWISFSLPNRRTVTLVYNFTDDFFVQSIESLFVRGKKSEA